MYYAILFQFLFAQWEFLVILSTSLLHKLCNWHVMLLDKLPDTFHAQLCVQLFEPCDKAMLHAQ